MKELKLDYDFSLDVDVDTDVDLDIKKRIHYDIPSYKKEDKIKEYIEKWNTIKHVYRYQTLYKICEKLFSLTLNKKLACLSYFIEEEENKIIMYAMDETLCNYPIEERVKKHINLLRRVYNNDDTLEYDNNKVVVSEVSTLFS